MHKLPTLQFPISFHQLKSMVETLLRVKHMHIHHVDCSVEKLETIIRVLLPQCTEDELIALISNHVRFLDFLPKPWSLSIQRAAIDVCPSTIDYIDNPSEELQLRAVRSNPMCITFINFPSEQVQQEAIRLNIDSFPNIRNPSEGTLQIVARRLNIPVENFRR